MRRTDKPEDASPLESVFASTMPTPPVAPLPGVAVVEAPLAAVPFDVAIASGQPATVSIPLPPSAIEAAAPAQSITVPNRASAPIAIGIARHAPLESAQPIPASVVAHMPLQPEPTPVAALQTPGQVFTIPDSPRSTPPHRAVQAEAPVRASPRDPLPPLAPVVPTAAPGTDRLLRARPNTAFAREEIAVTIGPVAASLIADTPIVRDAPAQIDTQSSDWMQSMIERIETLTGEHGQRETRLKLSPDALGEVELRLRESPDGTLLLDMDAVTPEARALLAEAAPRLVEMGEARGLRLSMQSGGSNDGQPQHYREPHRPGADAPLPNRRPAMAQGEPDDERIA